MHMRGRNMGKFPLSLPGTATNAVTPEILAANAGTI